MTNTDQGMPDKKFPWIWTAWVFAVVISFGVIEGLALWYGDTTLSRYTYELGVAWPPLIAIINLVVGGLLVHFWWHWSPPGSDSEG